MHYKIHIRSLRWLLAIILGLAIFPLTTTQSYAAQPTTGSWVYASPGNFLISAIVTDPTDPNTIYVGGENGNGYIYKSTDHASTWTLLNTNISPSVNINALAINQSNPNILYAATSDGVYETTDGGNNWSDVTHNITKSRYFWDVKVDPFNPSTVYVAGTTNCNSVWKSTDGGATWTEVGPSCDSSLLLLDPVHQNTIYMADGYRIYKSTDGGSSWYTTPTLPNGAARIVEDPYNSSILYTMGTQNGIISKSTDAGIAWTGLPNSPTSQGIGRAIEIDPVRQNTLYGGYYGAEVSTDGGTSWSGITGAPNVSQFLQYDVYANDKNTLYVGTTNGLYLYGLVPSNQAPAVGTVSVSPNPAQINTSVTATTTFTDPDAGQTHTATINWGDPNIPIQTCSLTEPSGSTPGSVSCTLSTGYTSANVFPVTISVSDGIAPPSNSPTAYVSVYDPTQGSIFSAGQRFMSPAGAYQANTSITGNVTFGLSYKYSGTMPVGLRQFTMDFNNANLHFNATSVTSLVIANGTATLQGTGTVNGQGTNNFLVTGINGGGIRIQITDLSNNIIYDTQPGNPITATPTTSVTGHIVVQ